MSNAGNEVERQEERLSPSVSEAEISSVLGKSTTAQAQRQSAPLENCGFAIPAVYGWVQQRSPCCAAAAVAGVWNALHNVSAPRGAPGSHSSPIVAAVPSPPDRRDDAARDVGFFYHRVQSRPGVSGIHHALSKSQISQLTGDGSRAAQAIRAADCSSEALPQLSALHASAEESTLSPTPECRRCSSAVRAPRGSDVKCRVQTDNAFSSATVTIPDCSLAQSSEPCNFRGSPGVLPVHLPAVSPEGGDVEHLHAAQRRCSAVKSPASSSVISGPAAFPHPVSTEGACDVGDGLFHLYLNAASRRTASREVLLSLVLSPTEALEERTWTAAAEELLDLEEEIMDNLLAAEVQLKTGRARGPPETRQHEGKGEAEGEGGRSQEKQKAERKRKGSRETSGCRDEGKEETVNELKQESDVVGQRERLRRKSQGTERQQSEDEQRNDLGTRRCLGGGTAREQEEIALSTGPRKVDRMTQEEGERRGAVKAERQGDSAKGNCGDSQPGDSGRRAEKERSRRRSAGGNLEGLLAVSPEQPGRNRNGERRSTDNAESQASDGTAQGTAQCPATNTCLDSVTSKQLSCAQPDSPKVRANPEAQGVPAENTMASPSPERKVGKLPKRRRTSWKKQVSFSLLRQITVRTLLPYKSSPEATCFQRSRGLGSGCGLEERPGAESAESFSEVASAALPDSLSLPMQHEEASSCTRKDLVGDEATEKEEGYTLALDVLGDICRTSGGGRCFVRSRQVSQERATEGPDASDGGPDSAGVLSSLLEENRKAEEGKCGEDVFMDGLQPSEANHFSAVSIRARLASLIKVKGEAQEKRSPLGPAGDAGGQQKFLVDGESIDNLRGPHESGGREGFSLHTSRFPERSWLSSEFEVEEDQEPLGESAAHSTKHIATCARVVPAVYSDVGRQCPEEDSNSNLGQEACGKFLLENVQDISGKPTRKSVGNTPLRRATLPKKHAEGQEVLLGRAARERSQEKALEQRQEARSTSEPEEKPSRQDLTGEDHSWGTMDGLSCFHSLGTSGASGLPMNGRGAGTIFAVGRKRDRRNLARNGAKSRNSHFEWPPDRSSQRSAFPEAARDAAEESLTVDERSSPELASPLPADWRDAGVRNAISPTKSARTQAKGLEERGHGSRTSSGLWPSASSAVSFSVPTCSSWLAMLPHSFVSFGSVLMRLLRLLLRFAPNSRPAACIAGGSATPTLCQTNEDAAPGEGVCASRIPRHGCEDTVLLADSKMRKRNTAAGDEGVEEDRDQAAVIPTACSFFVPLRTRKKNSIQEKKAVRKRRPGKPWEAKEAESENTDSQLCSEDQQDVSRPGKQRQIQRNTQRLQSLLTDGEVGRALDVLLQRAQAVRRLVLKKPSTRHVGNTQLIEAVLHLERRRHQCFSYPPVAPGGGDSLIIAEGDTLLQAGERANKGGGSRKKAANCKMEQAASLQDVDVETEEAHEEAESGGGTEQRKRGGEEEGESGWVRESESSRSCQSGHQRSWETTVERHSAGACREIEGRPGRELEGKADEGMRETVASEDGKQGKCPAATMSPSQPALPSSCLGASWTCTACGCGVQGVSLMGGKGTRSKWIVRVGKQMRKGERTRQWLALTSAVEDEKSVLVLHLQNHYALIFGWRERHSGAQGDQGENSLQEWTVENFGVSAGNNFNKRKEEEGGREKKGEKKGVKKNEGEAVSSKESLAGQQKTENTCLRCMTPWTIGVEESRSRWSALDETVERSSGEPSSSLGGGRLLGQVRSEREGENDHDEDSARGGKAEDQSEGRKASDPRYINTRKDDEGDNNWSSDVRSKSRRILKRGAMEAQPRDEGQGRAWEVLTARRGQAPSDWISFDEIRQLLARWSGYRVIQFRLIVKGVQDR